MIHPIHEEGWSLTDADYLLSKVVLVKDYNDKLVGLGIVSKIEQAYTDDYMTLSLGVPGGIWTIRLTILSSYTIKVLENL